MDISGPAASSAALTQAQGQTNVAVAGLRQAAGAEQAIAQVVDEQAHAAHAQSQGRAQQVNVLA